MEILKFWTWWRVALLALIALCCIGYIVEKNYSAALWVFYYAVIWVLWQLEHVDYMNSLRNQINFLTSLREENERLINNVTESQ